MRIILADHHVQPCFALRTSLEEQLEFEIIGEAVDAQGLLLLAEEHVADLVLLDSELPGKRSQDLITALLALKPRPIVIVMSSRLENSSVFLKAGADAFVSKGDDPSWLLEKLHQYAEQIKMKEAANINNKS